MNLKDAGSQGKLRYKRKISLEHQRKLHGGRIGKPAWNSGLKYNDAQKLKVPTFAGLSHTAETKNLMRLSARSKAVIQYDMNNNFIKEWSSAMEASKSLSCDNSDIGKCAKGRLSSVHNFIFKYK